MPMFIICGCDYLSINRTRLQFSGPQYWIVNDTIPEPTREYTVVLVNNWMTHPAFHTPSMAKFLKQAKLIETYFLHPLRHLYVNDSLMFCSHVRLQGETSILRTGNSYLFLCPLCVAMYAINGLPDFVEVLHAAMVRTDAHTQFPLALEGE